MAAIRMVIEVFSGGVQNVYVANEAPATQLAALIVDWDVERCEACDDLAAPIVGHDGRPAAARVRRAKLKPWRLLPMAGIQEVLDRVGWAEFGAPGP